MTTNDPEYEREKQPANALDSSEPDGGHDRSTLEATVELLSAENRRLRDDYARARRSDFRRTAIWLAVVGTVAALAGLLFPGARQVLFTLGAVGLFGGVLTYYLTPGRVVAAEVEERVYAACATNWIDLIDALGLQEQYLYLPSIETAPPRLFVPQRSAYELPKDRSGPISTSGSERGLVLRPTGTDLFTEFERALVDPLATDPSALASQLTDGLVEQFELARSADPDVDPDGGRSTVRIEASAYGAVERFDHPAVSFLAVGFAEGLSRPIEATVEPGESRTDWLVTIRWEDRSSAD